MMANFCGGPKLNANWPSRASAMCTERLGRKPKLIGRNRASKIGSSTLRAAAITTRSRTVGIAVLYARAQALWDLLRVSQGQAGEGSYAVLLDSYGVRVAVSSGDEELLFHPTGRLAAEDVDRMVAERRFGDGTRTLLEQPVMLEGAMERARGSQPVGLFTGFAERNGKRNLIASHRLANAPWMLFFVLPQDTVQGPVRRLLLITSVADAVALLLAGILALLWSRRLVAPIPDLVQTELVSRLTHACIPWSSTYGYRPKNTLRAAWLPSRYRQSAPG